MEDRPPAPASGTLLSDQPTIELIVKARTGDQFAIDALLQRCIPPLKRWAHGRLPPSARGALDTSDLVQEAVISVLGHLDTFEPRRVGAMQAYLRQSVINRIRDEIRRVANRPRIEALPDNLTSAESSPLDAAIQSEAYERYSAALLRLRRKDRELVVARIEAQWSLGEIAERFGFRTVDAARMAVNRALEKLVADLARSRQP
jgi:RNA polymerase sigma-70 factor (ECF subfamily)